VVAGGEWLAFAHQFNPAFATEIRRIEPLPHQRIALYDMILTQDRRPVLVDINLTDGQSHRVSIYALDSRVPGTPYLTPEN
jgi:hypothetical protein